MIKKYIIDGNNLIGKINSLWDLQKKDRVLARVKLVKKLDQFFRNKNVKVSLHFDGFNTDAIPSEKVRITYSENYPADLKIKKEIDHSKNPKVIAVISSDHEVQNYAKVNSCKVFKSEEFAKQMRQKNYSSREDEIIKSIDNDEMLKLFTDR